MGLLYLHNNKILVVSGKLAANEACCCVCCSKINSNDLLHGDEPYSWPNVDPGGEPTPMYGGEEAPPQQPNTDLGLGSCKIVPACLRWVCIKFSQDEEVLESVVYGGATVNDRDLVELVLDTEGSEGGGCWLYTIDYFGWKCYAGEIRFDCGENANERCPASDWGRTFFPSDTMFSIYKTQLGGGA